MSITDLYARDDNKILYDIKAFLIEYGIDELQINISTQTTQAIPDDLGEYVVAYKLSRSRL